MKNMIVAWLIGMTILVWMSGMGLLTKIIITAVVIGVFNGIKWWKY